MWTMIPLTLRNNLSLSALIFRNYIKVEKLIVLEFVLNKALPILCTPLSNEGNVPMNCMALLMHILYLIQIRTYLNFRFSSFKLNCPMIQFHKFDWSVFNQTSSYFVYLLFALFALTDWRILFTKIVLLTSFIHFGPMHVHTQQSRALWFSFGGIVPRSRQISSIGGHRIDDFTFGTLVQEQGNHFLDFIFWRIMKAP